MTGMVIFRKTLRDYRWHVFWWGLGLAVLAAAIVYLYPTYRDQFADFEVPASLQVLLGDADFDTPEGFLTAEFFSWTPILIVVFAIMAGTSLIAGEEVNGTLELLLAEPISRTRLILEKLAGFAACSLLLIAITALGWLVSIPFVDIDVPTGNLAWATIQLLLVILVFGTMAVWFSVLLPDRKAATGLVTAVAVVSFFIDYLGKLIEVLEPFRWVSVFAYYDEGAMSGSFDLLRLAVLLGLTALFVVLSIASFNAREIGVGGSQLSLPRLRPVAGT